MKIESTSIPQVYTVQLSASKDHRGEFSRIFCPKEFASDKFPHQVAQVNLSRNFKSGTIRGMHFQRHPFAEKKIITCLRGKVFDVAVDLRKHSPTFLKWTSVILSADDKNMVIIPEGCAHGFQTLEDQSELLYFHSDFYHAEVEGGLRFDDPQFKIPWPLSVTEISERDMSFPSFDKDFEGFNL